jgi:hypothetical protein
MEGKYGRELFFKKKKTFWVVSLGYQWYQDRCRIWDLWYRYRGFLALIFFFFFFEGIVSFFFDKDKEFLLNIHYKRGRSGNLLKE